MLAALRWMGRQSPLGPLALIDKGVPPEAMVETPAFYIGT